MKHGSLCRLITYGIFSSLLLSCSDGDDVVKSGLTDNEEISTEPGTEEPEPGTEEPNPGTEEPNPGTEEPNPGTEEPNPGTEEPNPGTEEPEPGTEEPNPGTEEPNPGTEEPEPGTEEPNPGTEEPNPGTEEPEPGTEEPEPVTMCGSEVVKKLYFQHYGTDVYKGSSTTQPIVMVTDKGKYDASTVPCTLKWTSSNAKVATIDTAGKITGVNYGKAILSVQTADGRFKSDFVTHVINLDVLNRELTADMIYMNGVKLKYKSVMQGFDMTSDGYLYFTQNGNGTKHRHENPIMKIDKDKQSRDKTVFDGTMVVQFAGHGQNVSIEEASDGKKYVWIGNYGTRDDENLYRTSQTISRFEYVDGKTYIPSDIEQHFTYPNQWNFQPALDVANDRFAIWGQSKDGTKRYLNIYKLSEVKAAKPVTQSLSYSITWGGGTSTLPEKTEKPKISVTDLSKLTPIRSLTFDNSSKVYSDKIQQGYAINNGKLYILNGMGYLSNDSSGKTYATVTVSNYAGTSYKTYSLPSVSNTKKLK